MDDLISLKRITDEAKRLSGPMTGDGWNNWGVYALIERQPSVPAVPLDKLCEWLAGNAYLKDDTEAAWELNPDNWKKLLKKCVEEQDADRQ